MKTGKITVGDIALIGMAAAIIEVCKLALSFIPNVELVSLLIILYTQAFKWRVNYIIAVFVIIEGILYGIGMWWLAYLFIWYLLAIVVQLIGKRANKINMTVVSGLYGLSFGFLCTIPVMFTEGPVTALGWWVSGIPYDIIHCVSNAIICFVLYDPLIKAFLHIKAMLRTSD